MPRSPDPDSSSTSVGATAVTNATGGRAPAGHQISVGAQADLSPVQRLLSDELDAVLPQTQCTRCGFPSCRDYANALATNETSLNRCPPGGAAGIKALAKVLENVPLPLDSACGVEGPRLLAWIDPIACIGCTKCIIACPADAIIGGPKGMHTVLPSLCTGCELCVPPCPVDCIELKPLTEAAPWSDADANAARQRFHDRNARRERELADDHRRFGNKARSKLAQLNDQAPSAEHSSTTKNAPAPMDRKRAIIEAAIERARLRQLDRGALANQQSDNLSANKSPADESK